MVVVSIEFGGFVGVDLGNVAGRESAGGVLQCGTGERDPNFPERLSDGGGQRTG